MNDETQSAETPLLDLLRGVPEDGRAWYEHSSTNHQNVPYGRLCNRAAAALEQAQTALTDCKSDWSNDAERYRTDAVNKLKRIEQLEALLQLIADSGIENNIAWAWIGGKAKQILNPPTT